MENQILHNGYPNQDTKKVVKWQNNPRPTAIMAVAQLNWWHGSQLEICCWPSWENCYLMDFLLANSAKQSAYYTFGQKTIIAYRTKDKNLMTCLVIVILVKIKLNESSISNATLCWEVTDNIPGPTGKCKNDICQ